MPKTNHVLLKYNRGIVSRKALGRVDIERIQDSAEIQYNYVPQVLGPMMLRPGLQYLLNAGATKPKYLPFVFRVDDTALPEFTDGTVKFVKDDAYLAIEAVATVVTNGDMAPDLTGWTDSDDAGATSDYAAAIGAALVALTARTVYDFNSGGAAVQASFKLDNDGGAYTRRKVLDANVYKAVTGQWKLSGAVANYEAYATLDSGNSLASGTLGAWVNLGTDAEWLGQNLLTNGTESESVIRVKIRSVGATSDLVSALITLRAVRGGTGLFP